MSLRARLVLGIVVLMACGLAVADVAGVALLRSYQMQRLDQQLSIPFGERAGIGPRAEDIAAPCQALSASGGQQLPTSFALLVLDRDGRPTCTLPRVAGAQGQPELSSLTPTALAAAAADETIQTVPGTTATGWRVRVLPASDGYIVLAVSLADADATVRRLTVVAVLVGLVILLLTAVGGLLIVRLGLRPLTAIERTADAIAAGDLSQRVESAPARTEVGRLSASLNGMLSQIEQAFAARTESEARLRRFVADASHELRTPLATVRGHAELYRQGVATSPEDVARLLSRIESESIRMTALVEDLLLLARLDSLPQLELAPVDALSIAADVVVDAQAQDGSRPLVLRRLLDGPWLDAPPIVAADEPRLRQILVNLVSNALRHTPAGTPVEVEVGVRPGSVLLQVVDHGPGLSADVGARVFERFYRGDAGRARQHGGTGLGLSIVASLVEAHHGTVRYLPTAGGGSTFVVDLPVTPSEN